MSDYSFSREDKDSLVIQSVYQPMRIFYCSLTFLELNYGLLL